MKKICLAFTILFLCINISCSKDAIENNDGSTIENTGNNEDNNNVAVPDIKPIEIEIVNLINDYRVSLGLELLKLEKGIVKIKAKEHNLYMIDRQEISHDLFDDRSDDIINEIKATRVGENVAYGYVTAKAVVDAWIASEGHRDNIIGNYNYFEISAEKSSNGVWYFTNIFVKK